MMFLSPSQYTVFTFDVMDTKVLFSILVPAYKMQYLKECIDSILSQTYDFFEVIIVDDASPYDIWSVVSLYNDKRIRYFRNEVGFGASNVVGNWNKCLEYATGDYVICMGDDDMLMPSCLKDYIDVINKYPGLNVYHTRTLLINEQSEICDIQELRPEYETGYSLWWHRWDNRVKQYIGDFLYRRTHLVENGGFYHLPLAWASDDITAVRAALPLGIANVQALGFLYRINSDTISSSSDERLKAKATELEKAWYESVLENADQSDPVDKILISLLKNEIGDHFRWKFFQNMNNDIKQSLFNVSYWINEHRRYGIKIHEIVLSVFRNVLYK